MYNSQSSKFTYYITSLLSIEIVALSDFGEILPVEVIKLLFGTDLLIFFYLR
jgi:hypothetical protein